jgi:protein involved in polysaccharide export with SLBB domain
MRSAIPDVGLAGGSPGRFVTRLALTLAALASVHGRGAAAQGTDTTSPPPADTTGRATGPLRSGDLLNLRVYRDSELTGKYLIDAEGNVQIPGLGVVRVAGLTPPAVTERLTQALRDRGFRTPEIAVWPEIRVSVLGEVRTPGLYSVEPGASLIEVLTLAGGPTEKANLRHTEVVRNGRARAVDLRPALLGGAAEALTLYSNDVVFVSPRRGFFNQENLTLVATFLSVVLSAVTLIQVSRH